MGRTPRVRVFRLDAVEEEDADEEEADVVTSSIVCFFVFAVFALLEEDADEEEADVVTSSIVCFFVFAVFALLRLELAATHGLHSLPCNVEPSLAFTLCT